MDGQDMPIEVDPLSTTPIYQQIRDRVVEAIGSGRLRRGDALVPVRTLAAAFGISPATVAKAYDLLRSEGLIASNAKTGTFVARDPGMAAPSQAFVEDWTARLTTLVAEARAQGVRAEHVSRHTAEVLATLDPTRTQVPQGGEGR